MYKYHVKNLDFGLFAAFYPKGFFFSNLATLKRVSIPTLRSAEGIITGYYYYNYSLKYDFKKYLKFLVFENLLNITTYIKTF